MNSFALLLADARLPTGGHAQSGGLEPALLDGLPADAIESFLRTRLRTGIAVDAGTAVVTLAAGTADEVEAVIDAWNARTTSQVVRAASYRAARGYLRLGARLGLDPVWGRRPDVPRPVAVGLLARHWRLRPADVARIICHDEIQAVASAALKLAPLDPLDTVEWTVRLGPTVDAVVDEVARLTHPDDIPAESAPLLEQWQHAHPTHPRRLFHA